MAEERAGRGAREAQPQVCFDGCKRELCLPTKGFKQLHRKLKQTCAVDLNRDEISFERIMKYDIYVLGSPQEQLSDQEFDALKRFVELGGAVLLLLGEGGDGSYSHLNAQLQPLGVDLNEDCVVRTVLHKYLHPKEVCITNGVSNREINRAAGKTVIGVASPTSASNGDLPAMNANPNEPPPPPTNLTFVYPHGLTLNVQRPSVPLLSSGFMAYPLNRPICSAYEHNGGSLTTEEPLDPEHPHMKNRRGRFLVMGSALSFEDQWIVKEENDKLVSVLFDYMLGKLKLNQIDADEPDITDYHYLPDTASLADRLRVAVEESDDLPRDFTQLFNTTQFKFDTNLIPEVVALYDHLNVKHEPLSLIHPEFQAPLPPRLPATFEPSHREPAPPALDLFDLDDQFASERVRLAQLTNKCLDDEDLEYFISESAEIMGVTKKLRSPRNRDPRALLDYMFRQIVQCKKSNPDGGESGAGSGAAVGVGAPAGPSAGGAGGAGAVRVFRTSSEVNGSNPTPFDGPWAMTLHADFGRSTIMGSINFENDTPTFGAQNVTVQGKITDDGTSPVLEWVAEVSTLSAEVIAFRFQGPLALPADGPPSLTGHVAWSADQSVTFDFKLEEVQ